LRLSTGYAGLITRDGRKFESSGRNQHPKIGTATQKLQTQAPDYGSIPYIVV